MRTDLALQLAIYGGLGVGVAIFTFALGVVATLVGTQSSKRLHRDALLRAIRAPMSFFDTTPIGRIMNRCVCAYGASNLITDEVEQVRQRH